MALTGLVELANRPGTRPEGHELLGVLSRIGDDVQRDLGALCADPMAVVVLAEYAGVLAGFGIARLVDDPRVGAPTSGSGLAVVVGLYVEAGFREVGVGQSIVDSLEGWAAASGARGLDVVALPGSREAKSLLEALGYKARAIVMYRALPETRAASDDTPDRRAMSTSASAVLCAGVIVVEGDTILLVRRGHEPGKGLWSLPGGRIESGESAVEAARREGLEETGLELEIDAVAGVAELGDTGTTRYHVTDFLAHRSDVNAVPVAGSDADDVAFVELERLAALELSGGLLEWLVDHGVVDGGLLEGRG